jgi:Sugar (and other) transporter
MNVRAQATGMASQTQNIGNSVVQQFFPALLNSAGFYCFYMFMGVNMLLAVFVWYCIPETKGVPLEEMDELFGGVNHVYGGAELMEMGKYRGARRAADRESYRESHRQSHRESYREPHRESRRESHRESHRESDRESDPVMPLDAIPAALEALRAEERSGALRRQ